MQPEDLLSLLGAHSTDPSVEAALVQYAVRNRPEVTIDEDDADGPVVDTQSWVKNSRLGIEFGFDDEAAWRGLDETEFGRGPMVMTQIYFYGQHQGVRPYPDLLPLGLSLSDDMAEVRRHMEPYESTRRSHVRDTWDAPGFRMTVSYVGGNGKIDFILCMLREPPLPRLGYGLAPVPPLATLIDLLGLSLTDPAMSAALDPLGLPNRLDDIEDTGEGDFRNPYGLSVDFAVSDRKPRNGKREIVLSGMTFYKERELDARTWPGELPCSLNFDDSLETAAQKMQRAPDSHDDDEFSGYAVWHEPAVSVHIFYSTMENRVARVSLFAPGVWRRLHDALNAADA